MTTQLSDDLRFQCLPPDEVRAQIRKSMDAKNLKYILIDETTWYNALTRCKHTISNIPIFATGTVSERPRAITEIKEQIVNGTGSGWITTNAYVYNIDYVHQNISNKWNTSDSYSGSSGTFVLQDCDDTHKRYIIEYEAICNPITMHHFYTMDLKDLTLLFKGQLMGQNKGSPFRSVSSVAGTYIDKWIVDTNHGLFIKRSAPILQLLSRKPLGDLQTANNLAQILQSTRFPKENEIAYKRIQDDHYTIDTKEQYEKDCEEKQVSAYYPIITAEMCTELIENIPRMEIDFGCFGLGSAGTGVLDQLSRSTFFEKYMLVDYDHIEEKNLRNQWYQTNQIGNAKVLSSANNLRHRSRQNREIITREAQFQDIDFKLYNFKYVMSAFDSIETRLEFLDTVLEDKAQVRYLIDTRYDELTASIFFIDLTKAEEVEYYRAGLLSDKEAFDKQREKLRIKDFEDFTTWLKENRCFMDSCNSCKLTLLNLANIDNPKEEPIPCPRFYDLEKSISCGSEECLATFKDFYDSHPDVCKKLFHREPESSCIRQNFIDIYHYTSCFVFDVIRIIEDSKEKPITHVDVTTDPLPNSIILRR